MFWFLTLAYGFLAFVAVTNLLLMTRPGRSADGPRLVILIPARNEAANLAELLPQLTPQAAVMVFDDESSDGTAQVAARLGAQVVRPHDTLPLGWTGKNRACHELGLAAAATDAETFVFIDADVRVKSDFADAVRWLCAQRPEAVISGFPRIVPGRGAQPLFLAWVGWVLLSANPFGIVSRTRMGHNRFTNGQFHVWPRDVYLSVRPNEATRAHVLEDVMIGRLLARRGVSVEVANISEVFGVKMYDTWRETLDGMSKNSYEITGSALGSFLFAALLLGLGWAWLVAPPTYLLLALSGFASALLVRSRPAGLFAAVATMPIILSIGAYTILRSVVWRRRGAVTWKGRTYG